MNKAKENKNLQAMGEEDNDFLKELNKRAKKRKKMRVIILTALLVAGIGTGSFIYLNQNVLVEASNEIIYRENAVTQGDIVVGFEESSSISLSKEISTLPFSVTIDEILVTSGQSVEVGDPLYKFDTAGASEYLDEYVEQLEEQQLAINKEMVSMESELENAKLELESALFENENADANLNITFEENANTMAELEEKLADTYEEIAELEEKAKTIDGDYDDILKVEEEIEYLQDRIDYYTELKNESQELANDKQADINELTTADKTMDVSALEDTLDDYNREVEAYEDTIENYTEEKDDENDILAELNEEFKENYDLYENSEEILEDIEALKEEIETIEFDIEKTSLSQVESEYKANEDYQTTLSEGELAQANYDLTYQSLVNDLEKLQEEYDEIYEEYEELKTSISEDGMVYAEVSGLVSSISATAGEEVVASAQTGEASVLTITTYGEVTIPITVSEEDILDVYVGQDANIVISAYEDETFAGYVESIEVEGARVGAASVSYTVNVKMTGENTLPLLEGMSADVTVVTAQAQDVIYVENSALESIDGKNYVNIKGADGLPVLTEVQTGFTDGRYTEIKSGLTLEDTILVESAMGATSSSQSGGMDMGSFNMDDLDMSAVEDMMGQMGQRGQK